MNVSFTRVHTESHLPWAQPGRYLERIADHATNIAERVVYIVEGKVPDLN